MRKTFQLMSVLMLIGIILITDIHGGPSVIRDNRITDLGVTPVLGRGYSIATNTFQSTCMKDVKITEPSYDFTYLFQDINEVSDESNPIVQTLTKIAPRPFLDHMNKELKEQKDQVKDIKKGTETGTVKTKKIFHHMIGTLTVDSYYASVDESTTKMSESAAQLLKKNDIPGFFSSCGSYYVRSIGRSAIFISDFKFTSTTTDEAKTFKYQLQREIKSFGRKLAYRIGYRKINGRWRKYYIQQEVPTETTETEDLGEREETFSKVASNSELTITTSAFGLGKDDRATLISYDVETYKAAIKDAFMSMQNPRTGKVTSIEVIPWVENTEFQSLIELEKEVKAKKIITVEGKNIETEGETLLLYEKKNILNQNAEFMAEIERADRNLMNIYYKAKICRGHINNNWKKRTADGKKIFRKQYKDRYVRNNRFIRAGMKLSVLDGYLSRKKINDLLAMQKRFMYGGGRFKSGARGCMNQLIKKGIFRILYTDIKSCQTIKEQMGVLEDEIIENHCMPNLFPDGDKPEDVSVK